MSRFSAVFVLALAVCGAPSARAGTHPDHGVSVGLYGGAHVPVEPWALGDAWKGDSAIAPGGSLGLRVSGAILRYVGVEANLGLLALANQGGT